MNRGNYLLNRVGLALILVISVAPALAQVGRHPSIHDTVAAILERIEKDMPQAEIRKLTLAKATAFLSALERETLGSQHLSFRVNVPVTVSVVRSLKSEQPFWLSDQAFEQTSLRCKVGENEFEVWQKKFAAGVIGLGVNSLAGGGEHYFVAVAPQTAGVPVKTRVVYPGQARLGTLQTGAKPYVDRDDEVESVPAELEGQTLVRTAREWRDYGRLLNVFLFTAHPSADAPDHCLLTWSGDPRTTQTIQWRTSTRVKRGVVEYGKVSDATEPLRRGRARTERLSTPKVLNDPEVHWHTVTLRGLEPGSRYQYRLGDTTYESWSDWVEFTTAPKRAESFSFVYMGDAQNGLDTWGKLVQHAFASHPAAAFYIIAGDLVNRGAERDDWDSLFSNAAGIFDRRPVVPAIGNHECQGGDPKLYLDFFDLPNNAPPSIERERAYAFDYGNALFVVLDSNLEPGTQTYWLERQLARTKAKWKFVIYHHPIYSSSPRRDNKELRESWGPIFDKYHVDLALQGHDHAYLRTYPMKANQRVATPREGTVYIVSVSGTKFYKQDPRDYTEFGMTNVATYQVLDVSISDHQLVYRAYDVDGKLRDELVIEK